MSLGSKDTSISFVLPLPLTLELPFLYARHCGSETPPEQLCPRSGWELGTSEVLVGNEAGGVSREQVREEPCMLG